MSEREIEGWTITNESASPDGVTVARVVDGALVVDVDGEPPTIISQLDHLRVLRRDGLYVVQCLDDVGGWRDLTEMTDADVMRLAIMAEAAKVAAGAAWVAKVTERRTPYVGPVLTVRTRDNARPSRLLGTKP